MKKTLLPVALLAAAGLFALPGCKKETAAKTAITETENAPFKQVNLTCPGGPTVSGVFTTMGPQLELAGYIGLSPSGDVTVMYYFYSIVDFQPGAGVYNITNNTVQPQVARVTYNPNGLVKTAVNMGPVKYSYYSPRDANGNTLKSSFEINPGGTGNKTYRTTVSKVAPNGAVLWKRYLTYCDADRVVDFLQGIAFGPDGSVYAATHDNEIQKFNAAGVFMGKAFYGEGPVKIHIDKNNYMYLLGTDNGTIQKISPAYTQLWKVRFEPTTSHGPRLNAVTVDNAGNVYVTGAITETSDLDPGPGVYKAVLSSSSSEDFYLTKLNSSGNFVWAMQSKALSHQSVIDPKDVAVDATGQYIYVAGSITGKVMFNGQTTAIGESNGDNMGAFVLKVKQCL